MYYACELRAFIRDLNTDLNFFVKLCFIMNLIALLILIFQCENMSVTYIENVGVWCFMP